MSRSISIVGFKPADDTWNKMKAVWKACDTAKVEIPSEVLEFFAYEEPGDRLGMEVDITHSWIKRQGGYDIDVATIPNDVKTIRIEVS